MPQETLAGLGTKIYIGKAQADGSLPHIEEMTEVDVKESAPLSAESNGERKGWNNTFSVSLTAHVTDEEKETRKAEAEVAIAISKQVLRNIEITRHKIRSQRIHGRRRKAMYRDLLRYLSQVKGVLATAKYPLYIMQEQNNVEQAILDTRLLMGKSVRCTICQRVDGNYCPVPVIGKLKGRTFTFKPDTKQ